MSLDEIIHPTEKSTKGKMKRLKQRWDKSKLVMKNRYNYTHLLNALIESLDDSARCGRVTVLLNSIWLEYKQKSREILSEQKVWFHVFLTLACEVVLISVINWSVKSRLSHQGKTEDAWDARKYSRRSLLSSNLM